MKLFKAFRAPTCLIVVTLLCCVVLLFVPNFDVLPAKKGVLASARAPTVHQNPRLAPNTETAPENVRSDDIEFHTKQGVGSKLDFNRLALEGMNSEKAEPATPQDSGLILSIDPQVKFKNGGSTPVRRRNSTKPAQEGTSKTSDAVLSVEPTNRTFNTSSESSSRGGGENPNP